MCIRDRAVAVVFQLLHGIKVEISGFIAGGQTLRRVLAEDVYKRQSATSAFRWTMFCREKSSCGALKP